MRAGIFVKVVQQREKTKSMTKKMWKNLGNY